MLHGGDGNDVLTAGHFGPAVHLGDNGNDVLIGSQLERNVLIGGAGPDLLFGSLFKQDILIGDSTTHDTSDSALLAILQEWTSPASLNDRITHLTVGGGLNGDAKVFSGGTVLDDDVVDDIFSGLTADWILSDELNQ